MDFLTNGASAEDDARARRHRQCPVCSHVEGLTDAIAHAKLLRDAQTPNSKMAGDFQDQIDELTEELLATKKKAPKIAAINRDVEDARYRVMVAAERAERAASRWRRTGAFALAVGVLLVLIAVAFSPAWWVPVVGVLLLAGGVAALFLAVRASRIAQDELDEEQGELNVLQDERTALMPTRQPSTG